MLLELIAAYSIGYEKPIDTKEALCMSEAIWHESRGEPLEAQVAVAVTIMNRVESDRFPKTVCNVVYQPYQFSYTLEDNVVMSKRINNNSVIDNKSRELAILVALQAVSGGFEGNHKALHYYNPYKVNPKWSKKFKNNFQIANHKWVY